MLQPQSDAESDHSLVSSPRPSSRMENDILTNETAISDMVNQLKHVQLTEEPGNGTPSSTGQQDDSTSAVDSATASEDTVAPIATEELKTIDHEAREMESLVGFARIYSGRLSVGDTVHVLGPKYSPNHRGFGAHHSMVTITHLYIVMGKDLEYLGV